MSDDEKRSRSDSWKQRQGKKEASGRNLKQRVKTARGRKISSTRWLARQLNDPYVKAAQEAGYRSRAAFKLIELDDKFHFLKKGARILDLGAAPGGWSQVAGERIGGGRKGQASILAVDMQEMEPIAGVTVELLDFMEEGAPERVRSLLGGPVDVVLSDMAAPATGHRQTDHLRIIALCEAAYLFAFEVLAPGGTFVAKVLQGGAEKGQLEKLRPNFEKVRHVKPNASRSDSAEMYIVAQGYRDPNNTNDL